MGFKLRVYGFGWLTLHIGLVRLIANNTDEKAALDDPTPPAEAVPGYPPVFCKVIKVRGFGCFLTQNTKARRVSAGFFLSAFILAIWVEIVRQFQQSFYALACMG